MDSQVVAFFVFVLVHCASDGGVLSFNLEPTLPVIKRGEPSSYFGFSVAQHSASNGSQWILVGAPLGQNLQPQTNRSGALFKCPISGLEEDCKQVVTDGKRVVGAGNLSAPLAEELKDGQWMGVNVVSQGAGRKVMVCAHRYIHQGKDFRWGLGLCHFLTENLEYDQTLNPCYSKQRYGFEDYGYCQAGTSASLLEDDMALLGAPGAFIARGQIYGISVSDDWLNKDRNRYSSPTLEDSPIEKYSYLGMSVGGGRFFDNETISYVAGAPKAANFSGQVIFFEKGSDIILRVRATLTGEGFASSYGYELATLDLNGDKRPDLVVGAPFYADRGAGGAAYVYLNTEGGFHKDTPFVRLTGPTESRFGYAISTIGDLNKDGYDDLAIGAPYAEKGSGYVYIYLGFADGVIRQPSQIIKASQHFPHIKTFGYSLSGGMDLDSNTYPDLLVGAYESDAVVLLRSRPILDIVTNVSELTGIDPNGKGCEQDRNSDEVCFGFEACFEIRGGTPVPAQALHVEYKIEAETYVEGKKFSRVKFKNGVEDRLQVVRKSIRVQRNPVGVGWKRECQSEVVYLKNGTKDIQTPIAFKLTYTLKQKVPEYKPNSPILPNIENYPILNQQEASRVFLARFEKDCGNNDMCESDLYVKATTDLDVDESNNFQLILGNKSELVVSIDVQNFGEPAYEAMLYITHPKSMPFIAATLVDTTADFIGCSPAQGHTDLVACPLGNPFKSRSLLTLKIRFPSTSLKDIEAILDFEIKANSTSIEHDEQNNNDHFTVHVIKKAELEIYGRSEPGNVFYGGKITGESAIHSFAEIGPRVIHEYQVFNRGPWKASSFNVDIMWPHQVENKKVLGKWLLYPESLPEEEGDVKCTVPPNFIDDLHLRPKRSVDEEDEEYEWVVAPQTQVLPDGKTKKYIEMNCDRGSAKCFKIECTIRNLLPKESAVIKIHSRLWNGTLVEEFPSVDEVRIRSKATIRVSEENRQDPGNDVAMAVTTCLPDLKLKVDFEGIPWWIYVLSIIAGILVLALIVYCLYRTGFFKRRRPEPTHTASVVKT